MPKHYRGKTGAAYTKAMKQHRAALKKKKKKRK